jgi:hypothetical protein
MPVTQVVVYQKPGSSFSSGLEAYQDKNSLYSAELNAAIDQCQTQMLADNILLEAPVFSWDQATERLTVQRVVSSPEEFGGARTFDIELAVAKSAEAGWELISVDWS